MTKIGNSGFPQGDWEQAKLEATLVLIDRAKKERDISYTNLVAEIQSIQFDVRDSMLAELLREISEKEDKAGRGMLTVLVVHKTGDKIPGPGFFDLAKSRGRDTSDETACWINEVNRVYAYWSSR